MNKFEKKAMAKRAYRALVKRSFSLDDLPEDIRSDYESIPSFTASEFQRKLSPKDISGAADDLKVDFASRGLIPLYDKGDNDFVVYNTKTKQLEMFNIADELSFMQGSPMSKLISRK